MNAALIVMNALLFEIRIRLLARRDELNVRVRGWIAFGRGIRISRELIEKIDESATELCDLGERVHFAPRVPGLHCVTLAQADHARSEMPRPSLA